MADRTHGVTTFKVDASSSSEARVVDVLPTVDEHHGLRGEWATDVVLEVRGQPLTPTVRSALEELGPFALEETLDGLSPGGAELACRSKTGFRCFGIRWE